jgi:hypothetical protein
MTHGSIEIAVYLRGEEETRRLYQAAVTVTPQFKEEETERAYSLELKLVLTATEAWVKTPEFLVLAYNGHDLVAGFVVVRCADETRL